MELPHVVLVDDHEQEHKLLAGAIIGRLASAPLRIEGDGVSEAHALVSYRGNQLHLVALRGVTRVDGVEIDQIRLLPAQVIEIGLHTFVVHDQHEPQERYWLADVGPDPIPIQSAVLSICLDDGLRVEQRWVHPAAAWIWSSGEGWLARVGVNGEAVPLRPGLKLRIPIAEGGYRNLRIELRPGPALISASRALHSRPIEMKVYQACTIVRQRGTPTLRIENRAHDILRELCRSGGGEEIEFLAEQVWPGSVSRRATLRRNLSRLRVLFRASGYPEDLVVRVPVGNQDEDVRIHESHGVRLIDCRKESPPPH